MTRGSTSTTLEIHVYSKQFEVELVDIMHKNSLWMRTLYTCTYT